MTSVALHPHEVARLQAEGSVMLVRPVEFDDNLDPSSAILLKSGDRFFVRYKDRPGEGVFVSCPWGTGDKLQVLEEWRFGDNPDLDPGTEPEITIDYRDGASRFFEACEWPCNCELNPSHEDSCIYRQLPLGREDSPWRPASTMPYWASRSTVEVLGVRAEKRSHSRCKSCGYEHYGPVTDEDSCKCDVYVAEWERSSQPVWVMEVKVC